MRLLFYPARTSAANPLRTARFALHGWNAQPVRAKRTIFDSYIFFLLGCAVSPLLSFGASPFCVLSTFWHLPKRLPPPGWTGVSMRPATGERLRIESGWIEISGKWRRIKKHLDTPSCCKAAFTAAAKLTFHVKNRFCGGRQSQHLNGLKPFSP